MKFNPEKHHRRSVRLKRFDYSSANAFFVTVCSYQKECLFGSISDGQMSLNASGEHINKIWLETAEKRTNIQLDEFIIMPNHFHAILWITRRGTARRAPDTFYTQTDYQRAMGTARCAPTYEQFGKPVNGSLPTIIRSFKSAATKLINESRNTPEAPVWQRNYYEHIIHSHKELEQTIEYIRSNPTHWNEDEENPFYSSL